MFKIFVLIISTGLILTGCDKKPSEAIGYGIIENGVYSNNYFNMSIKVPENWVVQSKAAQKEMMDIGTGLIAGDDNNLKNILKETQKQTVSMFSFFKYEQGSPIPFNPSIISVAERVSHMPGIKRGSDYHFHAKNILESGQLKYEFPKKIYTKDISGVSFDIMPTEIDINNITVHQEYYAARIKDYVLLFILSYSSDSEIVELNEAISKLVFTK